MSRKSHIIAVILIVTILLSIIEVFSFSLRFAFGKYLSFVFMSGVAETERISRIEKFEGPDFPIDRRPASKVISAARDAGSPVYEFLGPPQVYQYSNHMAGRLGLGGLSRRTVVSGGEFGPWVLDTLDQFGLRNDPEDWSRDGVTVFLGQSMIYGASVDRDKTFVGLLRAMGRPVVNLAYPSFTAPDVYLGMLREYLGQIRAKYVLWGIWDDMAEVELVPPFADIITSYRKPDFSQDLIHHQAELDQAYLAAIEPFKLEANGYKFLPIGPEGSHLADLVRLRNTRLILDRARRMIVRDVPASAPVEARPSAPGCAKGVVEHQVTTLELGRQMVSAAGARIIVVFYPTRQRMTGSLGDNDYCRRDILTAVRNAGFETIDLYDLAMKAGITAEQTYIPRINAHYTPSGHRVIADLLSQALPQ